MQLRRFTADSTPAALGAVRLALGDDAIILANRKIGDQVEIIATGQMEDAQYLAEISLDTVALKAQPDTRADISDDNVNISAISNRRLEESTNVKSARGLSLDQTNAIEPNGKDIERTQFLQPDEPHSTIATAGASGKTNESSHRLDIESRAVASLTTQSSKSRHITAKRATGNGHSEIGLKANSVTSERGGSGYLEKEIQALSSGLDYSVAAQTEKLTQIIEAQSAMINQYFKGLEVNLWGNSSPNRTLHLQRLFALGIGAELAIQLVERSNPEHSVEDALRHSFALLKSTLPIGVDKTFKEPGITILSGSPGAGKTTVLMKIATQHVKEHGNDSIVIICADTRRIGAFEELQAYGRLLGVPTVHAHDSSELDGLLNAFTHKKLVLIDHTLPNDADAVEIPGQLLKSKSTDTVRQLLVLSATAQSSTIDSLISHHCAGRSMQCVLTNLDADARLGEMLNSIIRHHLPIAYWSDSASIQKPLQKAEASVLIATAVAMSRRLRQTPDDEWLLRLVQPSDKLMAPPMYKNNKQEVSA